MKYSKEERLAIGGQIYNNEITKFEAAEKYGIGLNCARDYMRLYRDVNNLPDKNRAIGNGKTSIIEQTSAPELEKYKSMTKDELIRELVKARINEARLKKGYEVKGDGAEKVFVSLDSKNTK